MTNRPAQSPGALAGAGRAKVETTDSIVPALLNAKQAAQFLGVSERTLWTLTACGAVESVKVLRSRRYPVDGLRRWIGAGCPTKPGAAASLRRGGAA